MTNRTGNVSSRRRYVLAVLPLAAAFCMAPATVFAGSYDDYFRALKIDDAAAVKKLLSRGFDPNTILPERGDTGLILALRENSMGVFGVLVNAEGIDFEVKSANGDNALMIACYTGNKPAVEALLSKGAEVNRPGWTPLHYAAANGHNDIIAMLLEKSAYIDAESPNKTTPIMMAARGGHILTVKLLLDEGADVTLKNELDMTAIDFARKFGHDDIADGLTSRLKKMGKL
ncbi:ankyrin repeat domain-containing protein [Herbaspirillum sp. HC18]|nr:ankyrin repeat domain-containing protein [Herbaspirillum sp. HC18]